MPLFNAHNIRSRLYPAIVITLLAHSFHASSLFQKLASIDANLQTDAKVNQVTSLNPISQLLQVQQNSIKKSSVDDSFHSNVLKSLWNDILASPTNHSKQRTIANFIPRQTPIAQDTVILATHISSERFSKLLIQTKWWNGPISVAVYITGYDSIDRFSQFVDQHADQLHYTSFHVLLEDTQERYPHNILRNMALYNVESDYFFATDSDHIPSPNSYDRLSKLLLLSSNHMDIQSNLRQKTLLIFPAFEHFANKKEKFATEDMLPETKNQLLSKVKQGRMAPFQGKRCPNCHGPTDFDRWYYTTEEVYTLSNVTYNFEPYVVGYRHGIPRYWESFRGYGFDKISWFVQLTAAGYRYAVLRDFWVAHLRHPISPSAIKEGKARNKPYWMAFERHMQGFNKTRND
jgi:hypothetical protein